MEAGLIAAIALACVACVVYLIAVYKTLTRDDS